MERVACFTLDLEADYAGVPPYESYDSLDHTEAFENLIREHGIKLTTFVTGYILDKNFPILERLKKIGSRFETHTYSHPLRVPPEDKIKDIQNGIAAYERYFGEKPRGYRAPQGIISSAEVKFLADEGIHYSSSVFPSYLPGRYKNLHLPTAPFRYRDIGLLEIPMSVVPYIRLPITASHINLLTFEFYRWMMASLGLPTLINVCMHLYDFVNIPAYHTLPLKEKCGYLRTQLMRRKTAELERLARHLCGHGYEFAYLSDVAVELWARLARKS